MTHAEDLAVAHGVPRTMAVALHSAAHANGINYSLAIAVCAMESGFRNVWGHDPGGWHPPVDGVVTASAAAAYERAVRAGAGRQGVGPMQITSSGLQDLCPGRLWDAGRTTRVGVDFLAGLVHRYGELDGCRRYNGSGPAAQRYAHVVTASAAAWHHRVAG